MNVTKKIYSLNEVAELLGVTRVTIFRWVKSGKLKATRAGRSFVVLAEDIPHHLIGGLSDDKKIQISGVVKQALDEYEETFRALARE